MTDDYNEKNTADNTQREINMIEKGKQRFERRNAKKSLDQTKVGIDIISLNVGGVEEALKDLMRYRKAGAGGPKAKWEMHLYRLDANWDTQSVDATGKPIFNEIDDMNLFLAADLACRVSMECYHKGMTLTKLAMRAGRAFQVQLWAKLLQETNAGKSFVNSLKFITRQDSTDPLTRQERAMKIAKDRGYKEEDWDEAEILRVGTVMWNAVLMGGDIFANDLTKLEDDLKPTYYPILKPEIQQLITGKEPQVGIVGTDVNSDDAKTTRLGFREHWTVPDTRTCSTCPNGKEQQR